jgi:hypothetical protein
MWRIPHAADEIWLLTADDARRRAWRSLPREEAAWRIDGSLAETSLAHGTLARALSVIEGRASDATTIDLRRRVTTALRRGALVMVVHERRSISVARVAAADAAPLGPAAPTWFAVKLVDEIGDPLAGIEVAMRCDGVDRTVRTDATGQARLDEVYGESAQASIGDARALWRSLAPRWRELREPAPMPSGAHVLRGIEEVREVTLDAEVLLTIVLAPHDLVLHVVSPRDANATAVEFVLKSEDGAIVQHRRASEVDEDGTREVWFTGLLPSQRYRLATIDDNGQPRVLVDWTPYPQLERSFAHAFDRLPREVFAPVAA